MNFLAPLLASFWPLPHHRRYIKLEMCQKFCLMRVITIMVKGGHFMIIRRFSNIQGMSYKSIHFLLRNRLMRISAVTLTRDTMQMIIVQILMVIILVRVGFFIYHQMLLII